MVRAPMPAGGDDIQPIRLALDETQKPTMEWLMENLPLGFRSYHCAEARTMLGWSIEALAFRSGVSPGAIRRLEDGAGLRHDAGPRLRPGGRRIVLPSRPPTNEGR
ncbi:HTH cro/C1-type domain-containing protein [Pseudomonas donghuensis]